MTDIVTERVDAGVRLGGMLAEDLVKPSIEKGKWVRLLADWTPPFSGYHLYYPSRRQPTAALTVLLEALRYRDGESTS